MLKHLIILLSVISVMDFWSYIPFLEGKFGLLGWLINTGLLLLYFIIILVKRKVRYKYETIDKIAFWTISTILIGAFTAYLSYGQAFADSFLGCLRLSLGLFLYFVLRRWDYPVSSLIKIITFVSIVWVILEIGQQFTYPTYWFSGRYQFYYNNIDVRMGLYRYYIWGIDFVMLALAFWCLKFFSIKNAGLSKNIALILFACLAIGVLCYCSRKHIYAFMLLMIIPILKLKGSQRRAAFCIVCFAVGILLYNYYDEFAKMNKESMMSQEADNGEFIRFVSAKYFLFDFSNDWTYYLFGCGLETAGSRLQRQLENLSTIGIYQADVGIIGYFSKFGILGASAIIWYIVEFVKRRKLIDNWLIGFFIMKMMLIVFDFWGIWDVGMSAYAIFLYILHRNINENITVKRKRLEHEYRNINIPQRA